MNIKLGLSIGMAALVATGAMAFVHAGGQPRGEAAAGSVAVGSPWMILVSSETPQDEVWDMTYGAERPAIVEDLAGETADEPIEDYTFG